MDKGSSSLDLPSYSQSKVKTFRKCHAAYDYKYNQHLEPKRKARPLMFGTIVHSVLEEYGKTGKKSSMDGVLQKFVDQYDELFIEEQEYYGDIINDVHDIMSEYFKRYKDDGLEPYEIKGLSNEVELKVQVAPGIIFEGKLDRLMKRRGKLYLTEQKTFSRMPDDNHRWRDMQTAIYVKVLKILGHKVDGIMWDYIGSKPPTHPQILKDGDVGKRSIVTLPTTLKRFEEINKVKVPKSVWATADESVDRWFQRYYYPVNKDVRELVFEDYLETVRQIKEIGSTSRVRTIARHCDFCEYEPLCRARLGGLDEDFVKEKQFKLREKKDQTHQVEEETD